MRFSIIIPVYNAEKYLEKCLNSVTEQDYHDYEILLVNDGSKDSSGEICEAYAEKFSSIHYVRQENAGPSKARNRGIAMAEGEYLLFLDADDEIAQSSLKRMDRILSENHPDAILSKVRLFYPESNTYTQERLEFDQTGVILPRDAVLRELAAKRYTTPVWRVIVKRSIVTEHQIQFPTDYMIGEDIYMMSQTLCKCESVYLNPEPYYIYHQNQGSIMHNIRYEQISKTMRICDELYAISASMPDTEREFIHTQMSMMLVTFVQHYRKYTREQKKEIDRWMKQNKALMDAIAATHPTTQLAKRFIGSKNAFLLAGWAVSLRKGG